MAFPLSDLKENSSTALHSLPPAINLLRLWDPFTFTFRGSYTAENPSVFPFVID